MKILKPKFWDIKNNPISLLLIPISFFLQLLMIIKKKITFKHSFKIPIICIGNIYIGGTGKTPLAIKIAQELIKHDKKPAIIKKYYANHFDEHNLINNNLDCLFLNRLRSEAINKAEKKN